MMPQNTVCDARDFSKVISKLNLVDPCRSRDSFHSADKQIMAHGWNLALQKKQFGPQQKFSLPNFCIIINCCEKI